MTVVDDTTSEPVETFSVGLGNVVNATITKNRGTATIAASDQVGPPRGTAEAAGDEQPVDRRQKCCCRGWCWRRGL